MTSISRPNRILGELASGAKEHGIPFYLIGDVPSPADFSLDGCDFYSLKRQAELGFRTSEETPLRHYARKNIGYLLAASNGAEVIIETDDDNLPRAPFWQQRQRSQSVRSIKDAGWVNAYQYFTDAQIWPRGLPLDAIGQKGPAFEELPQRLLDCPIQQGLADENPDVDAIYRLILPLPVRFEKERRIGLGDGAWCPFNSQNTSWWADTFPLLYLPAYCSFRMTDIWRSFVAQRIAWANHWSVLFTEPTVWQERNDHSLMRDFSDEVPGYLHNRRICEVLEKLPIRSGVDQLPENLRVCYEALVELAVIKAKELPLLEAWLADLTLIQQPAVTANAVSA